MKALLSIITFIGFLTSQGNTAIAPEHPTVQNRVQKLGPSELEKLVNDRNGKPLLLNVWATWCAPCVAEFPDIERLFRKYQQKGLDVAVVSIDFDDEVDSKVIPFLKKMKATMPAYINTFDPPVDLIETLDPDWAGAVPASFVFDAGGEMVHKVIGKRTFAQFERMVTPVLNKAGRGRK